MSELVDERAFTKIAKSMQLWAATALYAEICNYERAKIENQKAAYVDDREASLPELPKQRAGYWGNDTHGRAIKELFDIAGQFTTCLEAVYKELERLR